MPPTYRSALTPRQAEIAVLLRERRSNKAIAKHLGLSHFTVRNHIALLMLQLHVDNRCNIPARLPR